MLGERCSSQASATAIGVASEPRGDASESAVGLQRREAAEREVRHVGDALLGQGVDQLVVLAVGEVVEVLHADDGRDRLRLATCSAVTVLSAEVPDQALLLQLGQRLDLRGDRAAARVRRSRPSAG